MPDNAFFFRAAYTAIIVLIVGYVISLQLRRAALEHRRKQQGGT